MSVNDSVSGGYFDLDIQQNYFVSSLCDLMVDYVLVYKGRCVKVTSNLGGRNSIPGISTNPIKW